MNEKSEFFELGEFINPLAKLARDYTEKEGTSAGLNILQQSVTLSKAAEEGGESKDLPKTRLSIRSNIEISEDEIDHLGDLAEQVGEESYHDRYFLMELVQAAAVNSCSLFKRNYASARLAVSAKNFERFERAREAYNDAVEGLQILARFFSVDQAMVTRAEQNLRNGWDSVREKSENRLNLFDTSTTDPATEWMDLLLWNADQGPESGLLAQVDSMLRLALRLEHGIDQEGFSLAPQVREMIRRCDALKSSGDEWISLLCTITVGDALAEVRQWEEAAGVYEHFLPCATDYLNHPLGLHAVAQGALCRLMTGELDRCRDWLSKFQRASAELLSKRAVTAAAELARFLAVEDLYGRRCGRPAAKETQDRVAELVKFVSMIVNQSPSNRVEYLRNLFYAVLARDLKSMSE